MVIDNRPMSSSAKKTTDQARASTSKNTTQYIQLPQREIPAVLFYLWILSTMETNVATGKLPGQAKSSMLFGEWMDLWYQNYCKNSVREGMDIAATLNT